MDFYAVDSGFLVCGTWIPDSNRQWDSGFLELYSGFQSPDSGFLSKNLLDSELHKQKFPDSGILYMEGRVVLESSRY